MSLKITFTRFRGEFTECWQEFLRATFDGPEEVAFRFGVTGQTALNWWNGTNAPSGAVVAWAFVHYADAARRHIDRASA